MIPLQTCACGWNLLVCDLAQRKSWGGQHQTVTDQPVGSQGEESRPVSLCLPLSSGNFTAIFFMLYFYNLEKQVLSHFG